MHEKGKYYRPNWEIKYDGEWINGKKERYGKYYHSNGKYYIGYFKNNLKNGKGVLYYPNGAIKFKEKFLNGKPSESDKDK